MSNKTKKSDTQRKIIKTRLSSDCEGQSLEEVVRRLEKDNIPLSEVYITVTGYDGYLVLERHTLESDNEYTARLEKIKVARDKELQKKQEQLRKLQREIEKLVSP